MQSAGQPMLGTLSCPQASTWLVKAACISTCSTSPLAPFQIYKGCMIKAPSFTRPPQENAEIIPHAILVWPRSDLLVEKRRVQ